MRDVVGTAPGDVMEGARSTLGGAVATVDRLPPELAMQVLATAREAFTDSLQLAAATSAVLVVVTAIVTAVVMRPVRARAESTGTAEPGGSLAGD